MNYRNLSKRDRLIFKRFYSNGFRFFLITGFIKIKSIEVSAVEANEIEYIERKIKFYFNTYHPFYLMLVIISFIAHLIIPAIGIFMFLAFLIDLPSKHRCAIDIINNMSRSKRSKRKRTAIRQYNGGYVYEEEENYPVEPVTEDEWESYYLGYSRGKSKKRSGTPNSIIYPYSATTEKTHQFSETVEYKPIVDVPRYEPSELDLLPDPTEDIPEEEKLVETLYDALQNNYIKSVERYLKRNYNIYPTDIGYVLERINRDKSLIYLDININYLKVWEGTDKISLLKSIIKDIEKGNLQLVTKQTLIETLEEYNIDLEKLPEKKQNYLEKLNKISRIPEELKLKKVKKK